MMSNSKPVLEGTVIMAENQYAGRGQQQNGWHAEPGKNLTFSLLLQPSFLPIADQFDLVRAVSLGVFSAIAPIVGDKLKIKWPNDLYYNDCKLGGMLIENIVQAGQIKYAVVGIGINVNQETFPASLPNAISVKQILHQDYDLHVLLADICRNIEAFYLNLKARKNEFVRNAYLHRLYWLNEERSFRTKGEEFKGIVRGVRDSGLLVVEGNNQQNAEFSMKEIEFLNAMTINS